MQKNVLLLVAAVVAGVVLFLLFGLGGSPSDGIDDDIGFDDDVEYQADPALRATGGRTRGGRNRRGGGTGEDGAGAPPKHEVWLAGTVIDARTREPLAGVSIQLEPAALPCPRLPLLISLSDSASGLDSLDDVTKDLVAATTEEDGTFQIARPAGAPSPGSHDLFALRSGYVTACVGRASGKDLVVHMEPGLAVAGRALNPVGHPVESAAVSAAPPEGQPRLPGTVAADTTDREGRFRLEGLSADAVRVTVDHQAFMPKTVGPREPGDPTPFDIRLVPAFRVSFHVRTDDGEPIVNPTIRWVTDGNPPAEDLRILRGEPAGPPARLKSELKTEVLRIPCDRRVVDMEIKADGYLPWTTKGEPLPPDGGERMFQAVLTRDTSIGALRIQLEDKDGKAVSYAESKAEASLVWMGPREQMPTSFVLQAGEVLDLPSMRAGPYRIAIRSPVFAPLDVDVAVLAGQLIEKKAVIEPPAKLSVRFVAGEALTVAFRVTQDGRGVKAFPEGKETTQPLGDEPEPLTADGSGTAVVLSGLGAGSYVVEVISENLVAARRSVQLTPGETEEVEIEVQRK